MSKEYLPVQSLGEILRAHRKREGMPLRKVAALLKVDVAILSKMERGERPLNKAVIKKLAAVYNEDPNPWLILFLRDKIADTLEGEELGEQAFKLAEAQVVYRSTKVKVRKSIKDTLIPALKVILKKQHLVRRAWLFGSMARGEEQPDSDVDLLIDVPLEGKFTLFDLAEIKQNIEQISGRLADIAMLNGLRPDIRAMIEKDMLLIYEEE